MDTNRFESARKPAPRKNPIVLGVRGAFWLFWIPVTLVVLFLIGAAYWLLTHPLSAIEKLVG
jgi:hypothetical protein